MRSLLVLTFQIIAHFIHAQSITFKSSEWAQKLANPSDKKNESYLALDSQLDKTDSATTFIFLNELQEKGKSKGNHFRARFNCLKARQLYNKNVKYSVIPVKEEVKKLFTQAIHDAYESEDEYLIAHTSINYGGLIYFFGETELSVMYLMNGVELKEKLLGADLPYNYQALGDLLYKIKEYNGSVVYCRKALTAWEDYKGSYEQAVMNCLNTTALGYHRQGIYDSAFMYYNQALQVANKLKNEVWQGIISGNMGQIYYLLGSYDTAYFLLIMDYTTSKNAGYFDNAANSLQWAARTKLAMGDKADAFKKIREAFDLLKKWPEINYLRNCYYAATQIFKEAAIYDSAFYYQGLYTKLNDSLEKVVAQSSITISKARMNDEKSRYDIQNLQRGKKAQLQQRNIVIAAILGLAVLAVIVINNKRIRSRLQVQIMQKEIASAKEQMKMFTENIIEKANLIEKLEEQVKSRESSVEQQMIIEGLTHQTILTEEDWIKFRALFEKIYPGFFNKLKEKANDISVAEQRMAALIRLHLTTRQAASMLGISLDSVHKTRQRLRQRIQIDPETTLEVFISSI